MNQLSEDIINKIMGFLPIHDINSMRLVNSIYRKKWHVYDLVYVYNVKIFDIFVLYKILLIINDIITILPLNLTHLDCSKCNDITDNDICCLTNLTHLNCSKCNNITDKSICCLTNLTYLDCSKCNNVTDKSICCLTKLDNLYYHSDYIDIPTSLNLKIIYDCKYEDEYCNSDDEYWQSDEYYEKEYEWYEYYMSTW